jgi:hypothetical protein
MLIKIVLTTYHIIKCGYIHSGTLVPIFNYFESYSNKAFKISLTDKTHTSNYFATRTATKE